MEGVSRVIGSIEGRLKVGWAAVGGGPSLKNRNWGLVRWGGPTGESARRKKRREVQDQRAWIG